MFVNRKRRRLGSREFTVRRNDRRRNIGSISGHHHHLIGHVSSYRNWSLSGSSGPTSYTDWKFSYHFDRLCGFKQSKCVLAFIDLANSVGRIYIWYIRWIIAKKFEDDYAAKFQNFMKIVGLDRKFTCNRFAVFLIIIRRRVRGLRLDFLWTFQNEDFISTLIRKWKIHALPGYLVKVKLLFAIRVLPKRMF